jgi:hypothetical protein
LEIGGPDRGLLIPRVALTAIDDITTIPSPATSLIVYNTASAGAGSTAVAPGFYYWNETSWAQLSANSNPSAGTVWNLGGNLATDPATDYIGTGMIDP